MDIRYAGYEAWLADLLGLTLGDVDDLSVLPQMAREAAEVEPTQGDDVLEGTSADEVVNLLGGDDTWTEPFSDSGDDRISGGRGKDTIELGDGNDVGKGGGGADDIDGGQGNDRLIGGAGADELHSSYGNNVIKGGGGNDRLTGASFDGGNDRILGGNGDDWISGRDGRDKITGGNGDDTIFTGSEDGVRDRLFYDHRDGTDQVFYFEDGIDLIVITGDQVNRFRQIDVSEDITGDALISFGDTVIELVNVAAEDIGRDDFVFV